MFNRTIETSKEQQTYSMLTTFDNPYNPFDDFINWFLFDTEMGYNTCSYMARLANITSDMTQKEESEEQERVIDTIITNDVLNIYKKVTRAAGIMPA